MADPRKFLQAGTAAPASFIYLWDSTGIALSVDGVAIGTGIWRAVQQQDLSSTIDTVNIENIEMGVDELETMTASGVRYAASTSGSAVTLVNNSNQSTPAIVSGTQFLGSISGSLAGTFTSAFSGITGSQFQIPVGARSYTIFVESGSAFVDGTQLNASRSFSSPGYGNRTLGTAINVGTTGGKVIVNWDL